MGCHPLLGVFAVPFWTGGAPEGHREVQEACSQDEIRRKPSHTGPEGLAFELVATAAQFVQADGTIAPGQQLCRALA